MDSMLSSLRKGLSLSCSPTESFNLVEVLNKVKKINLCKAKIMGSLKLIMFLLVSSNSFYESLRSKFFNGHRGSGKKASWFNGRRLLTPIDTVVRRLRKRYTCFCSWEEENWDWSFDFIMGLVWCDGGKLKNRFPERMLSKTSKTYYSKVKILQILVYTIPFRRGHPRGGLELNSVEELAKVINPVVLTSLLIHGLDI
ncbi:hypothetical protein Tco_0690528 [Tanacetum coccineum]